MHAIGKLGVGFVVTVVAAVAVGACAGEDIDDRWGPDAGGRDGGGLGGASGNAGGSAAGGASGQGGSSGNPAAPAADFGKDCVNNSDCDHGLCIEGPQGTRVCSKRCTDECGDPQWQCAEVDGVSADKHYCVARYARLCRPCSEDADCRLGGVPSDHSKCVSRGEKGWFCAVDCSQPSDCPDGYACDPVEVDGVSLRQCVPAGGADCNCKSAWANKRYSTRCYRKNEHGTCLGERTCDGSGLTSCGAATPEKEVCDGRDNNCDGQVDNGPVCDDGVSCTNDVCDPSSGCKHTLNANACLIDGTCYAAKEAHPTRECYGCVPRISQDGWSVAEGQPCDDGSSCTNSDACNAAGVCQGIDVGDLYEPNESIAQASAIGDMTDDSGVKKTVTAKLSGSLDKDWFKTTVKDTTGHSMSDAQLAVASDGKQIKACMLMKCVDNSELHYTCQNGSAKAEMNGYRGCCLTGVNPTVDVDINKCGLVPINDDSVHAVFGLMDLQKTAECAGYKLEVHF